MNRRVAILFGLALARAAHADPEAKALYEEGARYYDVGDYEHAVARFERVYTMSGDPSLLLNLAQAYRLWGPEHCVEASTMYQRYLDKMPQSAHRDEVTSNIAALRPCVDARKAARADLAKPPENARDQAPMPPAPTAAREPTTSSRWRGAMWIAGGIAIVAGGVAGTSIAFALGREHDLELACVPDGRCPDSESGTIDSYKRWRTIAIGASVTGVAALVFGGFAAWRAHEDRDRRVAVWASSNTIGITAAF